MKRTIFLLATSLSFSSAARGGELAAIIEDVQAERAGVEFLQYVDAGQVIELGRDGRLVIGYLRSCLRETITGGKVTVGAEKSVVSGGKIERERVECDGGKLKLSVEQAGKSAVVVFRRPPGSGGMAAQAAYKVYSTNPLIRIVGGAEEVEIERLDRPAKALRLAVRKGAVDLMTEGKSLHPGGLYRARAAGHEVVFRVDSYARSGGPVLGRLVSF